MFCHFAFDWLSRICGCQRHVRNMTVLTWWPNDLNTMTWWPNLYDLTTCLSCLENQLNTSRLKLARILDGKNIESLTIVELFMTKKRWILLNRCTKKINSSMTWGSMRLSKTDQINLKQRDTITCQCWKIGFFKIFIKTWLWPTAGAVVNHGSDCGCGRCCSHVPKRQYHKQEGFSRSSSALSTLLLDIHSWFWFCSLHEDVKLQGFTVWLAYSMHSPKAAFLTLMKGCEAPQAAFPDTDWIGSDVDCRRLDVSVYIPSIHFHATTVYGNCGFPVVVFQLTAGGNLEQPTLVHPCLLHPVIGR